MLLNFSIKIPLSPKHVAYDIFVTVLITLTTNLESKLLNNGNSMTVIKLSLPKLSHKTEQEARLLQRDRATRYVIKVVLCFTRYGS